MKMINKLVSIGSFVIFAFYLTAFLDAVTGTTEGYIKDAQSGEPISKAKIIFVSAKSEVMKYELYSDKKGYFYRSGLITGIYKVTVEKDGYLPQSSSIRVKLGEVAYLEIRLKSFKGLIPQSAKLSSQGIKLLDTSKYEEAIEKFTEAISEDQSNPVSYYYRGVALEKNGNIDKALEDYQKAIELKPDFILPISSAGKIYAKQRDFEKAIDFYKKAVELGDQDATTHYNYGVCLMNLGNNAKARAVLEKLLILDENYSDAYYQLGIIYIGLGEVSKAKEFLQKFIDMDPENKNASIAKEILKSLNLPLANLF
jgi:tetratricopeptide (TPR) repeat protein